MQLNPDPSSALVAANAELRAQLEEAQAMICAIRNDEVDALVVETAAGPQIYTLEGLEAETNRFRGEILAQVSDAVVAVDSEDRIIYLNAAAELLYGIDASGVLGRKLAKVYSVRWQGPGDEFAARVALRDHGKWRGENIHVRHDGRELHVESSVTALREIAGKPAGTLAVIRDVTERKRHEEKVVVSEIRYRRLFETAHDGVLILDPATGKIVDANPFMIQMLGYRHDQLVGKELFEIGLLKDEIASREMFENLKKTSQIRYENLPLESLGGRHQDVEVVANLYDENGQFVIQCNIRDITERKRAEERVELLMAEVNHRAKNLLAVVQALVFQTVRHGDPGTFAARLFDRIDGLAAGHDLLVENQWQGVNVVDLVETQLAHFKDLIGTRVLLKGPSLRLKAAAAQGIGMALHELATNAAKYGALSNAEGRVRVSWTVDSAVDPIFTMSWVEDRGPIVAAPSRTGFGRTVIGRMAEAAVQGVAVVTFAEAGVEWHLNAPVENALAMSPEASL